MIHSNTTYPEGLAHLSISLFSTLMTLLPTNMGPKEKEKNKKIKHFVVQMLHLKNR